MNKHFQSRTSWQLEQLETRQLLSASVGLEAPIAASTAIVAPMTSTPSLLGKWTGVYTDTRTKVVTHGTVNIATQSRKGALTGSAVVFNNCKLTGTISGDTFTARATEANGSYTTLKGTVGRKGKTITGTWTFSTGKYSGTFTLTL